MKQLLEFCESLWIGKLVFQNQNGAAEKVTLTAFHRQFTAIMSMLDMAPQESLENVTDCLLEDRLLRVFYDKQTKRIDDISLVV
jgi:hypothetical protein